MCTDSSAGACAAAAAATQRGAAGPAASGAGAAAAGSDGGSRWALRPVARRAARGVRFQDGRGASVRPAEVGCLGFEILFWCSLHHTVGPLAELITLLRMPVPGPVWLRAVALQQREASACVPRCICARPALTTGQRCSCLQHLRPPHFIFKSVTATQTCSQPITARSAGGTGSLRWQTHTQRRSWPLAVSSPASSAREPPFRCA